MNHYPLPAYAAYIWAASGKIHLTFPGYESAQSRRFNSVILDPEDPSTMMVLKDILFARSNATASGRKIGGKATPTRQQVAEMVASYKGKIRRARPKPEPKVTKADLDAATALLRQLGLVP